MPLQGQVNIMPAVGVHGEIADFQFSTLREHIPGLRAISAVKVGSFVWLGTAPVGADIERQSQLWATNVSPATGTAVAAFVYRNITATIEANAVPGVSMEYESGSNLPAAEGGAFYVVSTTAPTIGQKVFATEADGTIQYANAGATVSGAVETKFVVANVRAQNIGSTAGYIVTIKDA